MEVAQIVRDYMRVVVSGLTSAPESTSTGYGTSTRLVREGSLATGAQSGAQAHPHWRRTSAQYAVGELNGGGGGGGAGAAGEPPAPPASGGRLTLGLAPGALVTSQNSQSSSGSATARQVAPTASLDSALLDARFATLEHSVDTLLTSNVSSCTSTTVVLITRIRPKQAPSALLN